MDARFKTTLGRKVSPTNGTVVRIESGDVVAPCVGLRPGTKNEATKGLALESIVVAVFGGVLKPQLGPVVVF